MSKNSNEEMNIEIFSIFNIELEKIWKDFEDDVLCSPFQSYAWLSLWQNLVGAPLLSILPQIVIVRNDEDTMAIFPTPCVRIVVR